jgi:hypothetical protein
MGDKANNQMLLDWMKQMQAQYQALMAKAQEKSPLQQQFENESLDWGKFMKDPTRDYASFKPLNFDLQGAARRDELAKRTATGAAGLGQLNSNMVGALHENMLAHERRDDAANLEQNVENYDATMHGQGMNLQAEDQANRTSLAGLGGNMAQSAQGNYFQYYKPKKSIWSTVAGIAKVATPFALAPFTGGASLTMAGGGGTNPLGGI